MVKTKWIKQGWLVATACALDGCASTPPNAIAMVETGNAATTAAIIATLQQAMGTQKITLGPREGDLNSWVTVLPPQLGQYETRSVVMPEIFDVMMRKNSCFLVRRTTGVAYALNNVTCVVPPPILPSTGR
jgi:hypothetical protein